MNYTTLRPRAKSPAFRTGRPAAPTRVSFRSARPFGQGLGERHPVHRSPVSTTDLAWYEEQAAREEDLLIDRLAAEAETMDRLEYAGCF
jgi:hypothetical protein